MKHIDFARLIEKFEGGLSVEKASEVNQHISICSDCSAESAKLANFFAYSGSDATEEVPQAVTANLLNLYQRRPAAPEPVRERSFLSGLLVFDDWTMAVNERYSGIDSRQLLYRVGEYDIDLRLEFAGDVCHLAGQILPELPGAAISIASADNTFNAGVSEFGEFTFEPVPQGVYDIQIFSGSDEMILEQIPLQR